MSNDTKDGNGNGQHQSSLREMVRDNKEAMHKFASRLGDVSVLAKKFDELKVSIDKQTESNNKLTSALIDYYNKTDKNLQQYGTNVALINKSVRDFADKSVDQAIAVRDQKDTQAKTLEQFTSDLKYNQEAAETKQYVIITLLAALVLIFGYIAWNLYSHSSMKSDSSEVSAPAPERAPDQPEETPAPAQPPAGKSKKKRSQ